MIGNIFSENGYPGVIGIQSTPGYTGIGNTANITGFYSGGVDGYRVACPDTLGQANDYGSEGIGSWLVTEAVPEPETILLMFIVAVLLLLHHPKFRTSSSPG